MLHGQATNKLAIAGFHGKKCSYVMIIRQINIIVLAHAASKLSVFVYTAKSNCLGLRRQTSILLTVNYGGIARQRNY